MRDLKEPAFEELAEGAAGVANARTYALRYAGVRVQRAKNAIAVASKVQQGKQRERR